MQMNIRAYAQHTMAQFNEGRGTSVLYLASKGCLTSSGLEE